MLVVFIQGIRQKRIVLFVLEPLRTCKNRTRLVDSFDLQVPSNDESSKIHRFFAYFSSPVPEPHKTGKVSRIAIACVRSFDDGNENTQHGSTI